MFRPSIQPMLARAAEQIPIGDDLVFEPKLDGVRCLISVDEHGRVRLTSRHGNRFTVFPEVEAAGRALPADTVLDGELVIWRGGGTDFTALQERLAAGPRRAGELARRLPAHLAVFDVLILAGRDVRREPLAARRALLEELLAGSSGGSLLTLWLQTDDVDVARGWMDELAPLGFEGIMVKHACGAYVGGSRTDWVKVKHRHTVEAVIGAVTGSLARPSRIILGRYDAIGRLRIAGTTTALTPQLRDALAGRLRQGGPTHPWPEAITTAWGSDPAPIQRVVPDVVIEVSVDVANDKGRWRHPARPVRLRPELHPSQLPPYGDTH